MTDIYKYCPEFENKSFLLRLTREDDCADLLKVYSDEKAVPFFNSDNCNGDDFHYTTMKRMKEAIDFWKFSYDNRYFVRWTIINKMIGEAIGTVELCGKPEYGILRLDLRSDHEKEDRIFELLCLCSDMLDDFERVVTKAFPQATERLAALDKFGFKPYSEKLTGHDGTEYSDYYVLEK